MFIIIIKVLIKESNVKYPIRENSLMNQEREVERKCNSPMSCSLSVLHTEVDKSTLYRQ